MRSALTLAAALLLSLSQAEDAETCDAKDASAGNAAGSAKSLVLPSNAGHLVISVDDLEDRVMEGEAEGPPRSRSAWCQVANLGGHQGGGRCTLRAALELAATAGEGTAVTLALPRGRFRLAATLPEVVGTVQIVGSEGTGPAGTETKGAPVFQPSKGPPDNRGSKLGDHIGFDPHYERPPHKGAPGCTSPVGTVLDGVEQHQILRTGRASSLHLMTVRLENGRAMREVQGDPRASLGGAVSALGKLVLTNTVVSGNRAVNGGALYTEGEVEVHASLLQHNTAARCGGFLYAELGPRAHLESSTIRHNGDRCGRHFGSDGGQARYALGGASTPRLGSGGGGGAGAGGGGRSGGSAGGGGGGALARADGGGDGGGGGGGGAIDVSGAIAQGPSLTGREEAAAARRALEGPPKGGAAPQSSPQAEAEAKAEARAPVLCDPMGHGGTGGRVYELRCAAGSHAVGAFGSYGLVLNSLGLICSDGSRTLQAGGGDAASGEQPKRWHFACAGWRLCEDEEAPCEGWASAGECEANPSWMGEHCARSCGTCEEPGKLTRAPLMESAEGILVMEAAERVVGLEVRAGDLVDAVRVRCSGSRAKAAAVEEEERETARPEETGGVEVADFSSSAWFGGDGGALCELACDNGTALHGLSVKAGGRVDRIELGACEGGGDRRPGAWRMAEGKADGKARDQAQADETTKAAAAEAHKDKDGVPWRTWATAMKNGYDEKDEL